MTTLLEIEDLQVHINTERGAVNAVNGLTLTVSEGETLAVVGESGCGKSVSSLALLGLLPRGGHVTHGRALFGGIDLLQISEADLRTIRGREVAMIFQDPMTSLNPVLTVEYQISEILKYHLGITGEPARRRVVELLERVGIPDPARRAKEYPHQLSGGMRQRVMIAMAMVCEPRLLIADEPTTALDATIQAQILELLQRLVVDSDAALILITHDLGVAAGQCDRMAIMYGGMVVEMGPTEEVFNRPHHRYTQGLLASALRVDRPRADHLSTIPGAPMDRFEYPTGCVFAPRCAHVTAECLAGIPPMVEYSPGHVARCLHPVEEPNL